MPFKNMDLNLFFEPQVFVNIFLQKKKTDINCNFVDKSFFAINFIFRKELRKIERTFFNKAHRSIRTICPIFINFLGVKVAAEYCRGWFRWKYHKALQTYWIFKSEFNIFHTLLQCSKTLALLLNLREESTSFL